MEWQDSHAVFMDGSMATTPKSWRCTLCPGGQCTAWKRKGYTFDYCIHWLEGTASGPFHDIWKETGALDEHTEIWEDLNGEEYSAEKQKIALDATENLEKLYPAVKGNIELVDVATPLTDIRYTGVYRGAYEGFLPTSKNMTKTLSNTVKGLDNFYLAGQWLFQEITKKDKKKFKVA